jgi:hypothetical protein
MMKQIKLIKNQYLALKYRLSLKLKQLPLLVFSIFPYVLADGITAGGPQESSAGELPNPLDSDVMNILKLAIGRLIIIAIPVATIVIIYGAFQMLTASGDPEKFKKGEKTLLYAAIGFGALVLSVGIADLIKNILGA